MRYTLLDLVRGLAALWVFAFHYPRWDELKQNAPLLWNLMKQGHLGVSLFFVVSGYCLMASARSAVRREEPTRTFMRRRLVRIYPPLWCSMILMVALPWIMSLVSSLKSDNFETPALDYSGLGPAGWMSQASLLQIFSPGYERIVDKFSAVNSVYWTLAIEVQFYAIVGLALSMKRGLLPVLFITTVLGVIAAFIPALYLSGIFLPYWPMFAMGVALYLVSERGWAPPATRTSRMFGIAIFVFGLSAIGLDLFKFHPHAFAALSTAGLYFLRSADDLLTNPAHRLSALPQKALEMLGRVSYSLYLIHAEVMLLVLMVARQFLSQSSLLGMALTISITVALSYPFYLLCERPFITKPAPKAPA